MDTHCFPREKSADSVLQPAVQTAQLGEAEGWQRSRQVGENGKGTLFSETEKEGMRNGPEERGAASHIATSKVSSEPLCLWAFKAFQFPIPTWELKPLLSKRKWKIQFCPSRLTQQNSVHLLLLFNFHSFNKYPSNHNVNTKEKKVSEYGYAHLLHKKSVSCWEDYTLCA